MPAIIGGTWRHSGLPRVRHPLRLVWLAVVALLLTEVLATVTWGSARSRSARTAPTTLPATSSTSGPPVTEPATSTTVRPTTTTSVAPPSTVVVVPSYSETYSPVTTTVPPATAPPPASTTTLPPEVPELPASGAYEYETEGTQTLEPPGGPATTAAYPSSTSITVSRGGCGMTETWSPTSGFSTAAYECPLSGGVDLLADQTAVSFRGEPAASERYSCPASPPPFVPVTSGTVGERWAFTCAAAGSSVSYTVTLDGFTALQAERVAEVGVVAAYSGAQTGSSDVTYWLAADAGIVKETGQVRIGFAGGPLDGASYSSSYAIQLAS